MKIKELDQKGRTMILQIVRDFDSDNKRNQSGFNGTMRSTVAEKDKKEPTEQLKEKMVHWCCLMNMCPTSSTVIALERWVVLVAELVLQVVVGARGRTKTSLGHVAGKVEWAVGSEKRATGLVPGFAAYLSSTTVESERVGVRVVV